MKRIAKIISVLLVIAVLLPGTLAYASNDKMTSITDAKSAVVRVFSEYSDGSCATGSAFGIGEVGSTPEYFITNAHVCMDEDGNLAKDIYILIDSKAVHIKYDSYGRGQIDDVNYSKTVACHVVNEKTLSLFPDVAILKADKPVEGRTCIPLHKSSKELNDASTIYALGYPGISDMLALSRENSVYIAADVEEVNLTSGVVSKKTNSELYHGTDVILHSAAISSGNSGGPLLDETGAVVGINTYLLDSSSDQYVSIYIDYATTLLDELGIPYTDADSQSHTKMIIVIAIIAVTVLVAGVLIAIFKHRGRNYEARELRLQGINGYFYGRRFPIDTNVNIGCAPDNHIVFPTGTGGVSAHHCTVIRDGNLLYLKDNGSTYGTAINGKEKIPANKLVSVKVGDTFFLGSEQQGFQITYKGGKLSLSD